MPASGVMLTSPSSRFMPLVSFRLGIFESLEVFIGGGPVCVRVPRATLQPACVPFPDPASPDKTEALRRWLSHLLGWLTNDRDGSERP